MFKFDEGNRLGVTATGNDFGEFKSYFGIDDRGFGYIRIMVSFPNILRPVRVPKVPTFPPQTGDEMSKRSKFVLVTWVGQNVSVMKKAKMSTDKALMKDIIQVRALKPNWPQILVKRRPYNFFGNQFDKGTIMVFET